MAGGAEAGPVQFMRLRVTLAGGEGPWAVPVDYYRLLRGAVYHAIQSASPDLAGFLHEGGFTTDSPAVDWRGVRDLPSADENAGAAERFKLFCFSSLLGKGALRRGQLVFNGPVVWFFATPLSFVAEAMEAGLRRDGRMQIGRAALKVTEVRRLDAPTATTTVTAALLSPLVISATIPARPAGTGRPEDSIDPAALGNHPAESPGRRRRRYLTHEDGIVLVEARLRANLLAKHRALYGAGPEDPGLRFLWASPSTALPVPQRQTRLVRLSGPGEPMIRVRGSLGAVTLAGRPELLQLALHAGLGQYNASGMGFLLPESESDLLRI